MKHALIGGLSVLAMIVGVSAANAQAISTRTSTRLIRRGPTDRRHRGNGMPVRVRRGEAACV
jgi:hypothetical protein